MYVVFLITSTIIILNSKYFKIGDVMTIESNETAHESLIKDVVMLVPEYY